MLISSEMGILISMQSALHQDDLKTQYRNQGLTPGLLLFQLTAVIILLHFYGYLIKTQRTACKRQYSFLLREKGKQGNHLLSNFKCFRCNLKSIILTFWHGVRSALVYFELRIITGKLDAEVKGSFLFSKVVQPRYTVCEEE